MLTAVALALGVVVLATTATTSIAALAIAITLTRGIGQSALSIVSLAMVGKWFRRRMTPAMATFSVVMSIGFMAAFPIVGALVSDRGWRFAWSAIGVALVLVLAPLSWLVVRDTPESVGARVDDEGAGWCARRSGAAARRRRSARRCARPRSGCSRSRARCMG